MRRLHWNRETLFRGKRGAVLCLCLAGVIFGVVNFPWAIGAGAAATRQLPIYCVQRDQKVVSISFDAAWGDAQMRQ